ncbi:hypothetical protein COAQ111491_04950 [Comamonas aquatilis]
MRLPLVFLRQKSIKKWPQALMHQSLTAIKLAIHLSAVVPLQARGISPDDCRADCKYE